MKRGITGHQGLWMLSLKDIQKREKLVSSLNWQCFPHVDKIILMIWPLETSKSNSIRMTVVDRFGLGRIFVESATIVSHTETTQGENAHCLSQRDSTVVKTLSGKSATIVSPTDRQQLPVSRSNRGISHAHHPKMDKKYVQMKNRDVFLQCPG